MHGWSLRFFTSLLYYSRYSFTSSLSLREGRGGSETVCLNFSLFFFALFFARRRHRKVAAWFQGINCVVVAVAEGHKATVSLKKKVAQIQQTNKKENLNVSTENTKGKSTRGLLRRSSLMAQLPALNWDWDELSWKYKLNGVQSATETGSRITKQFNLM